MVPHEQSADLHLGVQRKSLMGHTSASCIDFLGEWKTCRPFANRLVRPVLILLGSHGLGSTLAHPCPRAFDLTSEVWLLDAADRFPP